MIAFVLWGAVVALAALVLAAWTLGWRAPRDGAQETRSPTRRPWRHEPRDEAQRQQWQRIESTVITPTALHGFRALPAPPANRGTSRSPTRVQWIVSQPAVERLGATLAKCKAVAIDLEHHQRFSFGGITCLIQISTQHDNYIIDPLAATLDLSPLQPALASPFIVKVIHG